MTQRNESENSIRNHLVSELSILIKAITRTIGYKDTLNKILNKESKQDEVFFARDYAAYAIHYLVELEKLDGLPTIEEMRKMYVEQFGGLNAEERFKDDIEKILKFYAEFIRNLSRIINIYDNLNSIQMRTILNYATSNKVTFQYLPLQQSVIETIKDLKLQPVSLVDVKFEIPSSSEPAPVKPSKEEINPPSAKGREFVLDNYFEHPHHAFSNEDVDKADEINRLENENRDKLRYQQLLYFLYGDSENALNSYMKLKVKNPIGEFFGFAARNKDYAKQLLDKIKAVKNQRAPNQEKVKKMIALLKDAQKTLTKKRSDRLLEAITKVLAKYDDSEKEKLSRSDKF